MSRRQEQHRQGVYGGEHRVRDHVGWAGAYEGRAGERLEAVLRPRVGGGRMDHRLLVADLVVG